MFVDSDLLFAATQFAWVAIASIAALLSFSLNGERSARRMLALFFIAMVLSEVASVTEIVVGQMPQLLRDLLRMISFAVTFFIAPLFLFHIRLMIRIHHVTQSRWGLWGHLALPCLAVLVGLIFLFLPDLQREEIFRGAQFDELPLRVQSIAIGLALLEFMIYLQWLIYVAWFFHEQRQHLTRVKQYFASTEGLEMRWLIILATALGVYSLLCLGNFFLGLFGKVSPIDRALDGSLMLIIVIVLALWGLRPSIEFKEASQALAGSTEDRPSKYVKSALAPDHASRIARKLIAAMQKDRLYRDPNLTLGAVSKHIGVTTNYVSQTLNEHMRQTFFEFVNSWRVDEAIPLLEHSDQTVLAIAYEVGFNSRSSFYTAFKKKTDLTPSAYKTKQATARSISF